MNPADNFDEMAQLQAKVTMLSAAMRKMDTNCAENVARAANSLTDCAGCFVEMMDWHAALYQSIRKFTRQDNEDLSDLSYADTDTVKNLAAIGRYLADSGYNTAQNFRQKAEEVTK
jgi:hypothetical protein